MSLDKMQLKLERAERALERAELRLDQYKKADAIQKLQISQLESIIMSVRNCVTPRVEWKISAEQEPILEKSDGKAKKKTEDKNGQD